MDDVISRQAAIDAINEALKRVFIDNGEESLGEKVLKNVQSAQQERKRGRWLAIGNTALAACECGYITDRYYKYNYCPNCGAEMKGESDGRKQRNVCASCQQV